MQTKTLDDIKSDMSNLYDELLAGNVEVKLAGELANITGKYLKATQLDLAERIFQENIQQRSAAIKSRQAKALNNAAQ
jgi:hypothetical protein